MVRKRSPWRKFGGKDFHEHYVTTTKAAAQKKATTIKQNGGGPTRVIKSGTKYIVYERAYRKG